MTPRLAGATTKSDAAHASPGASTRAASVVSAYRAIALLLLNTLLLFILLNLALGVFFYLRDKSRSVLVLRYPKAYLAQVYPHMREKEWRALLTETWHRPWVSESFAHFKEGPSRGKYVNVSDNGFRMNKRQGPWPPNPRAFNIFFFGGSTTFGFGVRDDETIPSVLQDLLSHQVCASPVYVYNFGHAAYYSSQEQILFARLLVGGFTPQLAIFFDGINEFLVAGYPAFELELRRSGKPEYKPFSMKLEMSLFRAARAARARLERFLVRNALRGSDAGKQPDAEAEKATIGGTVLSRYLRNKALIEAMGARFGVETVFVWQPSPAYGYDLRYHLFPPPERTEMLRYGYSEFNKIRARLPERGQEGMLWLGDLQRNKKEPLYVDQWHYTAAFSREIAEQIAQALVSRNLVCRVRASLTERK